MIQTATTITGPGTIIKSTETRRRMPGQQDLGNRSQPMTGKTNAGEEFQGAGTQKYDLFHDRSTKRGDSDQILSGACPSLHCNKFCPDYLVKIKWIESKVIFF